LDSPPPSSCDFLLFDELVIVSVLFLKRFSGGYLGLWCPGNFCWMREEAEWKKALQVAPFPHLKVFEKRPRTPLVF